MAFQQGAVPKRSHKAKPPACDDTSHSIMSFFKPPPPPPQVGRPAGLPLKKRGPRPAAATATGVEPSAPPSATPPPPPAAPPTSTTTTASSSSSSAAAGGGGKRAAAAMLGVKLARVNWGHGEPLKRLTEAVNDWDAKTGAILAEKPDMNLSQYAKRIDIPYNTLHNYTRNACAYGCMHVHACACIRYSRSAAVARVALAR